MKRGMCLLLAGVLLLLAAACAESKAPALFATVCSAQEALMRAKEASDVVVIENGRCVAGDKVWAAFWRAVEKKTPATVLCAHDYKVKEGHTVYFYWVEYDGSIFTVTTRSSSQKKAEGTQTFAFLRHFTGEAPATASFSHYDNYVLVDDLAATWEEIQEGIYSSQSDAGYRHCTLYMNNTDD